MQDTFSAERTLSINVDKTHSLAKYSQISTKVLFIIEHIRVTMQLVLCKYNRKGWFVMYENEKSKEELLKEIMILKKTIEVQKNTINTLINQYVLKTVKRGDK